MQEKSVNEYERILTNPSNVIMSDGLLERLAEPKKDLSVEATLVLDGEKILCPMLSYACSIKGTAVKLEVSHVDFHSVFCAETILCEIYGEVFDFSGSFTYENDSSTSILILSTSHSG
mgnify:CR=1 FL=1